jgi:hypothetical protein
LAPKDSDTLAKATLSARSRDRGVKGIQAFARSYLRLAHPARPSHLSRPDPFALWGCWLLIRRLQRHSLCLDALFISKHFHHARPTPRRYSGHSIQQQGISVFASLGSRCFSADVSFKKDSHRLCCDFSFFSHHATQVRSAHRPSFASFAASVAIASRYASSLFLPRQPAVPIRILDKMHSFTTITFATAALLTSTAAVPHARNLFHRHPHADLQPRIVKLAELAGRDVSNAEIDRLLPSHIFANPSSRSPAR